jgi:hypothetical protein
VTPAVREAFDSYSNSDAVRYVDYWDKLTAKTDAQLFQRFLFAFCSVHTTWEGNISGYKAIEEHEAWRDDHAGLRTRLIKSGVGLHNNRSRWIGDFAVRFWAEPNCFKRGLRESWSCYRDRLEAEIVGLGPAKVSFALELAYPLEAQVLCLDVHMLRLYGKKDQTMRKNEYQVYEADWVGRSQAVGLPPYIVKQIYWDTRQGKVDSRYWSHVLEE